MYPWKDIITRPPDDGALVTVRRIPINTPPFSAHWAPSVGEGGFLCGPERWFLPWWRVFRWRSLVTSLDWPIPSSSARPYRDTFLDYPSDSQHVWLRRDWPGLAVLHAVWDRGTCIYRIPDTGFSLPWWATHSWKPYRA